jgi:hypothetical protein
MQKVESYNIVLGCFDDLKIFKYQKSAGVFKPYQNHVNEICRSNPKYENFIQSFKKTPPNISPKLSPLKIWGKLLCGEIFDGLF